MQNLDGNRTVLHCWEMPNNALPSCPVCQTQRKAQIRLISSCSVQIPAQGTEHSTELQIILAQEIQDKGPHSSPAPLQTHAEHIPQHQAFSHVSTGTTQSEVTTRILQGIDFS